MVIPVDRQAPVRFSARISGNPSRVVLELEDTQQLVLSDDGLVSDEIASDGIFSTEIAAQFLTQDLQSEDVFRRFVGFLQIYQDESLVIRGNVFAEIITEEIPRLEVKQLSDTIQFTDHLVNIVVPDFYNNSSFDFERIARKFYEFFQDKYQFLNIIATPSYFQNRFHFIIKNEISGIGLSIFDQSAQYGSSGALLGVTMFPNTIFFDGASPAYLHELGHQWINYLDVEPLRSGIPHWPLSSLASGIMGWSIPPTGQGGEFPCALQEDSDGIRLVPSDEAPVYKDLDLYLMGLMPEDQVGIHYVFPQQNIDFFNQILTQCQNQIYSGELIPVQLSEVIQAVGNRVPDWQNSIHDFKIATIIVSEDSLLDPDAMAYYSFFAQRAASTEPLLYSEGFVKGMALPFFIATRGLGSLDTMIRLR